MLLMTFSLSAADIFVSNDGSASGSGAELDPLNNVGLALGQADSGDRVLLERGSVFREGELSVGNGVSLMNYGEDSLPLPVICGSAVVLEWIQDLEYPEKWSATVDPGEEGVRQVYVDGCLVTLARYPNQGWLRTEEGSEDDKIICASLAEQVEAGTGYWVGAQVRWRKWSWWYETRPIVGEDGADALILGGETSISGLTGIDSGFYIDGTIKALDAPGEWYWDDESHRLSLIAPSSLSAEEALVEVAWRKVGLYLREGSVVEGIHVRHYTETGIEMNRRSTVRNCRIDNIGGTGIRGTWDCAGSLITGCDIRDILNVGISWVENPSAGGGSVIEHNELLRIGTRNGLGGSGPWHAAGIILSVANESGNGVVVRNNRITETGYAGVIMGADWQTVERNVFKRCMNTLNDGAAIYTNSNHSIIRENIILDTVGDTESAQPFICLGHGIWLEFLENFRDSVVVGNTVYGSGGNGIFLPNNYDCTVSDNVLISNRTAALLIEGQDRGGGLQQDHVFSGNLLGIGARPWAGTRPENMAKWANPDDVCLSFGVDDGKDWDYGSFSETMFLTQDGHDLVRNSDRRDYTMDAWQAEESAWADSSPSVVQGAGYLFINDTEEALDYPLPEGVSWIHLDGASVESGTVAIEPYQSMVLLANGGKVQELPGYFLASELSAAIPFADWISQNGYYGIDALAGSDPDGDELPNFVEYYFNMDPMRYEGAVPLRMVPTGDGKAALRFDCIHLADLSALELQVSTDMRNWEVLDGSAEVVFGGQNDEADTVEIELSPESDRWFVRMLVRE